MGYHLLNLATLTMDLGDTARIVADGVGQTKETGPTESHIKWDFPNRQSQPAFKFHWYDGGRKPSQDLFPGVEYDTNGILMVGTEDRMLTHYSGGGQLKSGRRYSEINTPELFGPCDDWFAACKGGPQALSNFDKAGPATEVVLHGQVAMRAETEIEWDAKNMKETNKQDANQYFSTEYRKGWEI